jgi:hypothetical protein
MHVLGDRTRQATSDRSFTSKLYTSVRPSTFNTTVLGPSTPQGLAGVACQKNPMSQPHRSTADDDYGSR